MARIADILKRRVKGEDKELEEFRQLLTVPDKFTDGFDFTSLLGTLFVALVMIPGSQYMELVAGGGIGGAAQWVTVLLFVEVAKRANAKLSRAQLLILFYMSGMIMGRTVYGTPLFTQFLVRSDASIATGVSENIPIWVSPSRDVLQYLPRTFFQKAWLPFLGLMIFRDIFGNISNAVLSYGLFRLTSDIERLPFPMVPVGAQGILAMAEQVEGGAKSSGTSMRWRMFCIGAGIGMVFGLFYMALPTLTGAFFEKPLMIIKIPFADFTTYTEKYLPATATGICFDLGTIISGMVMPFWSMVGSFIGLLFTFVMNPILYYTGRMPSWEPGQTTVLTLFSNNIDFYFSFQIGISLAIALFGIYASLAMVHRGKKHLSDSDQKQLESIESLSRRRGHVPTPWVIACYFIVSFAYILMSGWLIDWHKGVVILLFFFAFIYTPLISYVTARLEGLAGQVVEIPFITELSFILSGYKGVAIWFLPIPKANYGAMVCSYKQAELLGCKFTSLWKAQFFLFPIVIGASLLFTNFIWGLAEVPSTVYPYTMEMWELNAKNACLVYSATLGEYSQFNEALSLGRFLGGFGSAGILMGILGWFGAPTMLFFGVVRGLGQSMPHSIVPSFIGALIGRFYFEKKYGREWRKMIPVIGAGFGVGVGLISMLSVGLVFLSKSVSSVAY